MPCKDAMANRIFTDEEILYIRKDYIESGYSIRCYYNMLPVRKACYMTYYFLLSNKTYRYLLPGEPFRLKYDTEKQKTI